jgi:dephospho-CoA kinase
MAMLIAITGGIGSGKSVVSNVLATMGYPVYDTDSEARRLMNADARVREALIQAFGHEVFGADGTLNRAGLASKVFNNPEALQLLNSIVHPAVRDDVKCWCRNQASPIAFVETAILHQSKMDAMVDAVWTVTAPMQVRIERVMHRSGLTASQVADRIRSQQVEEGKTDVVIENDGEQAILPQIVQALHSLKPCKC